MNQADEVEDLHIDLALHELLGGQGPPDLTDGILLRLAQAGGARVGSDSRRHHRGRRLLTAAVLLLGLGVIWVISRGSRLRDDDPIIAPQDPIAVPQDPKDLPAPVRAEPSELDGLPEDLLNLILVQATDTDLARLVRFRDLRSLELTTRPNTANVAITDAGMAQIAELSRLRVLHLRSCRSLTADGLARLAALPLLRELSLVDCRSDADQLSALPMLPGLRVLALRSGFEMRDDALRHVNRLVGLERLDLRGQVWLTSEGLVGLGALRHLRELDLGNIGAWTISSRSPPPDLSEGVDDGVLEAIGGLPELEILRLASAKRVTGTGIDHLQRLSRLRVLELSHVEGISDPDLMALRGPLEELDLSFCSGITGHALSHLGTLRILRLDGCSKLEDGALTEMPTDELRELSLRDCDGLNGEIIASLPDFHRLERLDFARCGWVRDEHLRTLASLHELRTLSLDGNPKVTDAGLAHLRALDKLEELDLRANPNVTADGLKQLESLSLRRLTIAVCRQIPDTELEGLRLRWPRCEIVR